jgi:lipid A oxidase
MRALLLPMLLLAAAPAAAEVQLSFYGGWAGAPDDGVTLSGDAVTPQIGVPVEDGSQGGVRATWWTDGNLGVALDYSRFDLPAADGATAGLTFEGLDTLTVSGLRRWEGVLGTVNPYVGAGVGLGVAEAEVGLAGAPEEIRVEGPAVSWVAGATVPLGGNWAVFGEYEGTYTDLDGEAEDGRTVDLDGVTNSINLGVSFSF